MKKDQAFDREWRRRITSGVFKAMAETGRPDRGGLRDALEVTTETVNRYLDQHRWTLGALMRTAAYYGKTPADVLMLGAATPEEHLPAASTKDRPASSNAEPGESA